MKKPLYLHIGLGKTGTTALQDFFGENRKQLKKHGICYPDLGTVANAHHLLSPYIPPFLSQSWKFLNPDQWAPKIAKVREPVVLLSSELMGWTEESAVIEFCTALEKWFDVHVVVYLRRQDNIIMASYNQQVKVGQQKRHLKSSLKHRRRRFDFLKIIEPWANQLGDDKILVRIYERGQFYKNDIRLDFMHYVLQVEPGGQFTFLNANANPRLSGSLSDYKLLLNNVVEERGKNLRFDELLTRYAQGLENSDEPFSDYSVLSASQRMEIIAESDEANATIARRFLGREDGRLFYDPPPTAQDDQADLPLDDRVARCIDITRHLMEQDPELMDWLASELVRSKATKPGSRKFAAHTLEQFLVEVASE